MRRFWARASTLSPSAIGWFSPLIVGVSLLLQPAVAALLGWLLFGRRITARQALAMISAIDDGVGRVLEDWLIKVRFRRNLTG